MPTDRRSIWLYIKCRSNPFERLTLRFPLNLEANDTSNLHCLLVQPFNREVLLLKYVSYLP